MTNEMHSTIDLSPVAEIEASTHVLSIRTNAIKVELFAVKIEDTTPLEAENMEFIAANSEVLCQRFTPILSIQKPRKDTSLWILSLEPTCKKLLPSLISAEKTTVSKRIKETLDELRTIPSPGYFGNLNDTPYIDDNNPIISEPFEDQEQMNQGILEKPGQTQSPHYIRLLQEMVNRTLKNHRIVFTRGGLQPKNIMERREIYDNGSADFKVTLIDWNLSGCYAKFWDFLQFNIVLSNETGLARARSRHNLICTRWNIS
ncbi:hypothetical protein N7463_004819 [Penicillium fimorum]|uniref:Uncharacterized protein n=1 Tax=Penicillium fimorum TaxID=1882269 RepID=A0A9W9XSV3_9EURO|nr:hypothetical protein N7463_004819 [Penicillium fimorum]